MGIYLPPSFHKDVAQRKRKAVESMLDSHVLREWTGRLKAIDPYLEMRRMSARAAHPKAGYYVIVRHNEGAPPTVMFVEGEHGEFCEPTSRVFEILKGQDLWADDGLRELRDRIARLDAAEARQRDRERAERVEKLSDAHKAKMAPGVSMSGRGWRARAGARRA